MGYFITIKNDLLDSKHVIAMGSSVWLYMWLIDKVMAINENGIGKVLNGRPVTYERIVKDLGISQRTCQRWLSQLEKAKYIRTIQAPYGHVIYINKAAKMWGNKSKPNNQPLFVEDTLDKNVQSDLKKVQKTPKIASKMSSPGWTKLAQQVDNSVQSNNDNTIDNSNIDNTAKIISQGSEISKLYYQVIAKYELPVLNHNVIKSKIKQWDKEQEQDKVINYLKFLLGEFQGLKISYKPELNNALDIYSKRISIKNAIQREINKANSKKIREV